MQRLLNDGWSFAKLPTGSTVTDALAADWVPVDIPHDFLIGQENNLYETADGWYRRVLIVPEETAEQVWLLRFDGVYMDCDVLVNGDIVCIHRYGYTAFDADLTELLHTGENEVMVHIRHQSPNSRWYSGAGIFRDVTLHVLPRRHIVPDGIYVTTARTGNEWVMTVGTELTGPEHGEVLTHRLLDADGEIAAEITVPAEGKYVSSALMVPTPCLWSCEHPYVYTLETILGEQTVRQNVGFRSFDFTTDRGLFLNGEHVKIHGVCLHHDLGALGAAFHEKAARRQLLAMKGMGVNSLRTSHNPPAKRMMDLCDELGILVVDEAFDMWERPKTTYDYARFFDDHYEDDVAAWVRRDRNHPSLLMWSIGNEILDTHVDARGQEVTRLLAENVRLHDPKGNGKVTIGSNFMPWEGAQKCAELVEVAGYNYGEKYYESHHAAHPAWVIYGSETASALSSRGVYRFPMSANILSDEDLQCSSLGNSTSSWGTRDMRACIVDDLNTPYSLGQYLWSGIDYIGEPTPYHTRSCYFGMMDTACFPKDYWYLFRALWTDEPMAHIGVYWDWNPGQLIDVPVMTTGAEAELFLNGKSLGRKAVNRLSVEECLPVWQVPFEAGELCAVAYDADGCVLAEETIHTPGDSARIILRAEDECILADGKDMTFVTISMEDESGHPVDNAVDRVHVSVTGGRLLGLDNGDSTDKEGYKTSTRRLFSGKLLAMVGAGDRPGMLRVEVSSPGKESAVLEIPMLPAKKCIGGSCTYACPDAAMPQDVPVRRIDLAAQGSIHLTAENPEVTFVVRTLPENADPQPLAFRVTNAKGITSPCGEVTVEGNRVTVTARGDGLIYLRATCNNGYEHTRVISQIEISIEGVGKPNLDPYGFIVGGLFDLSEGEIGSGNEQGVSFARDGESMAGYTRVDFGSVGSDEITLPIFALNSERYEIGLWLGDPRNGGEQIDTLVYQKPSIWNTYQAETYKLSRRLTGLQTICFTMHEKVHMKGFSFTRQSRAWLYQHATAADTVYGDSFTRSDEGIMNIGNNVSLVFGHMDFGDARHAVLTLDGATSLAVNPVTIRYENENGEQLTALAQFAGGERGRQSFMVEVLPGVCTVSFVFLPGSQFDFYGFKFERV